MNILIPDSWLREYLDTKVTQNDIQRCLSLCGPSVERIAQQDKEVVYDIEVTSNRPDAMSVVGIAREAAAILPRFDLKARLLNDPYRLDTAGLAKRYKKDGPKKLAITTDPILNPRFTAIVIDKVKIAASPAWLKNRLEASGIRTINNVVDVTNYIMRGLGQPVHAFDYGKIKPKNGIPTMILRDSKKGEKITTLDGKTHTLPGDDIVIADGSGHLIDLCGIMGGANSHISEKTHSVVLFLQTYDPTHIRKTSMALSHRTEAASLFEKGLDAELVLPAMLVGIELLLKLTGGSVVSRLYDIYPKPYKPYSVSVSRQKLDSYLGTKLPDRDLKEILEPLGFTPTIAGEAVGVSVPSFRRDVTLDVDIIEEIAGIYGYQNIGTRLPDGEPPLVTPDPLLAWEEEVKVRLRDWGYTELYTYSMISEELMDTFGLDKTHAYKITNPLSSEWVYMRPSLWPGLLTAIKDNLSNRNELRLFELSMIYEYRSHDLPNEHPYLVLASSGERFSEVKGLAEALFALFGIPFPDDGEKSRLPLDWYHETYRLAMGGYGTVGQVHPQLLRKLAIKAPITILDLDFSKLVREANPTKQYRSIPKHPPVIEDMAFVLPPKTSIGPLITTLKKASPLVVSVKLFDSYEDTRTLRITYQHPSKNLTTEDVRPVRDRLVRLVKEKFDASLKAV